MIEDHSPPLKSPYQAYGNCEYTYWSKFRARCLRLLCASGDNDLVLTRGKNKTEETMTFAHNAIHYRITKEPTRSHAVSTFGMVPVIGKESLYDGLTIVKARDLSGSGRRALNQITTNSVLKEFLLQICSNNGRYLVGAAAVAINRRYPALRTGLQRVGLLCTVFVLQTRARL